MKRDTAITIAGITKHQYYYRPTGKTKGRKASEATFKIDGDNVEKVPITRPLSR